MTFRLTTWTAGITCTTRMIPALVFPLAPCSNRLSRPVSWAIVIRTDRIAPAALAVPQSSMAASSEWKKGETNARNDLDYLLGSGARRRFPALGSQPREGLFPDGRLGSGAAGSWDSRDSRTHLDFSSPVRATDLEKVCCAPRNSLAQTE